MNEQKSKKSFILRTAHTLCTLISVLDLLIEDQMLANLIGILALLSSIIISIEDKKSSSP